jgi:DNA-binding GntR family transcriptional regulator
MQGLAPVEFKPESLGDVVYAAIRDAIVTKRLRPGERVTEAGLADRLKVSKTPVREAIARLQDVGLIEADEKRGNRVIRPSLAAFEDAYEMREALEAFTAEKAAALAGALDIREIRDAAKRSLDHAEADRIDAFRHWDAVFHDAIARTANNPRLMKAIDEAVALIGALRERDLAHAQAATECARSHIVIAEAIASHDPATAAAQMRAHLRQTREYTVLAVEPALDTDAQS